MTEKLKISKKGKMFKVEKRYTIRYAYAGIRQYFDVYEDKDGNLSPVRFSPQYARVDEVPSVEHCKTVNEVLDVVNGFCNNSAKIHLINGQLPFYYKNDIVKDYIKNTDDEHELYLKVVCTKFFYKFVLPVLIEKGFKVSTSHIGIPILIKIV